MSQPTSARMELPPPASRDSDEDIKQRWCCGLCPKRVNKAAVAAVVVPLALAAADHALPPLAKYLGGETAEKVTKAVTTAAKAGHDCTPHPFNKSCALSTARVMKAGIDLYNHTKTS